MTLHNPRPLRGLVFGRSRNSRRSGPARSSVEFGDGPDVRTGPARSSTTPAMERAGITTLGRGRESTMPAVAVVARPELAGAERRNDELFIARAALRRAIATRTSADLQIDQLRELVARLEAERRPGI